MRLVNDKMFKAVFGSESTKEILTAFLNAILDYPEDSKITELTLMNPFSEDNYMADKTVVMDIKAKDKKGRYYNIEIQIVPPFDYVNRVVFYLAKLLGTQLQSGETYKQLEKTISISIVSDKEVFKGLENFHNIFRYKHIEQDYELGDITELHFIELTKFVKTQSAGLQTQLDKWISFLKFGDFYKESGRFPDELEKDKEIAMAIEQFGKVSADERFMHYLMDIAKANRDRASELEHARDEGELKGRLEGELKGKLEGELKGRLEGELKGRLEGEYKTKLDVAAKMIAAGASIELIKQVTGLSEEEINGLN